MGGVGEAVRSPDSQPYIDVLRRKLYLFFFYEYFEYIRVFIDKVFFCELVVII